MGTCLGVLQTTQGLSQDILSLFSALKASAEAQLAQPIAEAHQAQGSQRAAQRLEQATADTHSRPGSSAIKGDQPSPGLRNDTLHQSPIFKNIPGTSAAGRQVNPDEAAYREMTDDSYVAHSWTADGVWQQQGPHGAQGVWALYEGRWQHLAKEEEVFLFHEQGRRKRYRGRIPNYPSGVYIYLPYRTEW